MASTFTSQIQFTKPTVGDPASRNLWGGLLNTDWDMVDAVAAGVLTLSLTNTDVTLSSTAGAVDQSKYRIYNLTGTLTGNVTIFWPQNLTRAFTVVNNTTGAFTVTLAVTNPAPPTPPPITQTIGQGSRGQFWSDGTNIYPQGPRIALGAPITLYVATSGNDTNNGLSVSSPFLTIQKAWNTLLFGYDLNGYSATISVADGTYAHGVTSYGAQFVGLPISAGLIGQNAVSIVGDTGTPSNVVIQETGTYCFNIGNATANISGMLMRSSAAGCIALVNGAQLGWGNCVFDSCASGFAHIKTDTGALGQSLSNYSVSSGALAHNYASGNSRILNTAQVNFTVANEAFGSGTFLAPGGFAVAVDGGTIYANGMTFTGNNATVTGSRFWVQRGGGILTGTDLGSGPNTSFFPGNNTNCLNGQAAVIVGGVNYPVQWLGTATSPNAIGPLLCYGGTYD